MTLTEKTSEKIVEIKNSISEFVLEEFPVMSGLYVELENAFNEMLIRISDGGFVEENY
jgi:hypothetical protein